MLVSSPIREEAQTPTGGAGAARHSAAGTRAMGSRRVTRSGPWQNRAMDSEPRGFPPPGVLLFLGYAFLILSVIGLSMRWVIDSAVSEPISFTGLVVMILLAYTIFTITMTLQRKQAAHSLAVGLSTLTVPATVWFLAAGMPVFAVPPGIAGVLLFAGLRRPASRAYFSDL